MCLVPRRPPEKETLVWRLLAFVPPFSGILHKQTCVKRIYALVLDSRSYAFIEQSLNPSLPFPNLYNLVFGPEGLVVLHSTRARTFGSPIHSHLRSNLTGPDAQLEKSRQANM